ncbi:MAG TPA: RNA polymerase sigma factor, partial [Iamia sp.]|nr:RNA polymerase sigma factor [Iamia sp.]
MALRTDQELLAAVAEGDRGALRELYDRHVVWVSARLRRRCADRDVVDEAVQDTFVAVWKGAGRWDGRGEPAAWIWGIAIRRLIGVLRTRRRWSRAEDVGGVVGTDLVVAAE